MEVETSDVAQTALYLAMREAYDNGVFDIEGYGGDINKEDAWPVMLKEYQYLLTFGMWNFGAAFWENGSLSPEWNDNSTTPEGIFENNPLGYALFETYFSPVISKPSISALRLIFQDDDQGVSGYRPTSEEEQESDGNSSPEVEAGWVNVGGNIGFDGVPLSALVLINGQTQFSNEANGRYDMEVPVDDKGMIKVQVFVDGFAPFSQIVTSDEAGAFPVAMVRDEGSAALDVSAAYVPSATEGWFIVSGSVTAGGVPACALVLANGQSMFSCGGSGEYSLEVPADQDDNVTLMVFAAGFKPFSVISAQPEEPHTESNTPGTSSSGPTFKILETHPSKNLACMDKTFNSFINVFGIYVISTSEVPEKYLQHTANVLAQYLDNDADGKPDDQKVASYLADNGYVFPLWTASARDKFWEQAAGTPCEEGVKMAASLYYPGDQWAIGGIKLTEEWDTNLEEVWHLVTAAFYEVYPEDFSDKPSSGSTLVRSMDKARGGSFQEPPSRYPSNAWYTNGEGPYEVQAHEYLYWALMSNFNALSAVPSKCQEVQPEWKVCTKKDLEKRDIGVYKLLNQKGYAIPTKIPDGIYKG